MPFDATPIETKPDVFSLEGLIAWLEKQPSKTVYCYMDRGRCLAAQFNALCGRGYFPAKSAWDLKLWFNSNGRLGSVAPDAFENYLEGIAVCGEHNFGAALTRAKKLLAERAS